MCLFCCQGYQIHVKIYTSSNQANHEGVAKVTHTSQTHHTSMIQIMFAHVFSGCDMMATPFGHGKSKLCALVVKNPYVKEHASVFYKSVATKAEISHAGEWILMTLYRTEVKTSQGINDLRYNLFMKITTKWSSACWNHTHCWVLCVHAENPAWTTLQLQGISWTKTLPNDIEGENDVEAVELFKIGCTDDNYNDGLFYQTQELMIKLDHLNT